MATIVEEWDEIETVQTEEGRIRAKLIAQRAPPPMQVPESPHEMFHCQPFNCAMAAYHCPQRQLVNLRIPGFKAVRHYLCQSGKCVQGNKIARQPWAKKYAAELLAREKENDDE